MNILCNGHDDSAGLLYERSIRSAHLHKFIHEEAIASELAADFSYKQGHQSEAYALYMHSINCFNEWGALAVAKRVEDKVKSKFASHMLSQLKEIVNVGEFMGHILQDSTDTKKRRATD